MALVRFAVINGEEQTRAQLPAADDSAARHHVQDSLRRGRAIISRTWVQDQKVDDWTDDRLKTGGVGLYSERGETRRSRAV